MLHSLHLYTLLLPEGQMGEACKLYKSRCCFGNWVAKISKVLSLIIERINVPYSVLNIEWLFIKYRSSSVASSVRISIKCSEEFHKNVIFVYCNTAALSSECDREFHFHGSHRSEGASYKWDLSSEMAVNSFSHFSFVNSHYLWRTINFICSTTHTRKR